MVVGALVLCGVSDAAPRVPTAKAVQHPNSPAPAQPAWLSSWSVAEMRQALTAMGLTVTRETRLDNFDPLLVVRAASGAAFVVQGAGCSGTGVAARCQGANLVAFVDYDAPAKLQAAIERLTYPAVIVKAETPNTLNLSRYVIFDEGIRVKNLQANVAVFLAVVDEARALQ
jgi:hypothetical protein